MDGLYPPDLAVDQHHLDPVGMLRTAGQNAGDDTLGQFSSWLILFFYNKNPHSGLNFVSFWKNHKQIVTAAGKKCQYPNGTTGSSLNCAAGKYQPREMILL